MSFRKKVVRLFQFKYISLSWRVDSCTVLESESASALITSSHKASKVSVEEIVRVSRCNIFDTKLLESKKLPAKCFEIISLCKRCLGLILWAISLMRQEKKPIWCAILYVHAPYCMRTHFTSCACAVLHTHLPYSMAMHPTKVCSFRDYWGFHCKEIIMTWNP